MTTITSGMSGPEEVSRSMDSPRAFRHQREAGLDLAGDRWL